MPLPEGYLPGTTGGLRRTPPPPKSSGSQSRSLFNPSAALDTSQVAEEGVSAVVSKPPSEALGGLFSSFAPHVVEGYFAELNNQPLPTQGNVANLVAAIDFPESGDQPVPANYYQDLIKKSWEGYNPEPDDGKSFVQELFTSTAGSTTSRPNKYADTDISRMQESRVHPDLDPKRPRRMEDVHKITWDEYQQMDTQQQRGVDYNTALVQAVRRDLKFNRNDTYQPDSVMQASYEAGMAKVFAPGKGTNIYAPETLALLDELGLKGYKVDMDRFLNLKAAITDRVLKQLGNLPPLPETTYEDMANQKHRDQLTQANERQDEFLGTLKPGLANQVNRAEELTNQTDTFTQQMAQANMLLKTWKSSAAYTRSERSKSYGGVGFTGTPAPGFELTPADFDTESNPGYTLANTTAGGYYLAYQELANASTTPERRNQILQQMGQALKPDELQGFYDYIDIRSKQAQEYDMPLGNTAGVKYLDPKEFRKQFNLDR